MSFWDTSFLWFEAVVASTALAVVCAIVGVYAILRRVVFLPAALSQISGLGVVLAFGALRLFPSMEAAWLLSPSVVSLGLSLLAALFLGWLPEPRTLTREALIGIAYIVASALVVLIADRIPQESHHIEDILFGNAVAVEQGQMVTALIASTAILLLHIFMFRPFLAVSYDPQTASAHGVPVRIIDAILFLSMGGTIAIATRTIGAMPVFAYSVLPAAASLIAFTNIRLIVLSAGFIGGASAFFGYWLSFSFEVPTGACTVALCALFMIPAKGISILRRRRRSGQ